MATPRKWDDVFGVENPVRERSGDSAFEENTNSPLSLSPPKVSKIEDATKSVQDDEKKLLEHFEKKLWLKILNKVNDPNDLEKLSNSSLYIRKLLWPRRVLFLFQSVLPLSEKNGRLKHATILQLHFVCESWSNAVDHFYQVFPYLLLENPGHVENISDFWQYHKAVELPAPDLFSDIKDIRSFLRKFDPSYGSEKRNPFYARYVHFKFYGNTTARSEKYMMNLRSLLLQYGHHIWYCKLELEVGRAQSPLGVVAQGVRSMLQLMPHLKTLNICCRQWWQGRRIPSETEIEAEILEPFPSHCNLRFLGMTGVPTPIFHGILQTNAHVPVLYVSQDAADPCDIFTEPGHSLDTATILIESETNFDNICSAAVNWSFKRIYLEFNRSISIPTAMVFDLIQSRWADGLAYLHLVIPNGVWSNYDERRGEYMQNIRSSLNLPRLTKLKVKLWKVTSLDFILPTCNLLEVLSVDIFVPNDVPTSGNRVIRAMDIVEENSLIKLLTSEPSDSNIWPVFPRLQHVRLRVHVEIYGNIVDWECSRPNE